MNNKRSLLAGLMLASLVGGCASSGSLQAAAPIRTTSFPRGAASVRVVNRGVVTSETAATLAKAVQVALLARRDFQVVKDDGSTAPVTLQLTVTGGKEVDEISRIGLGVLAGAARLAVRVEVFDAGRPLDAFDVQAKSSSGTIFSGTTDQAASIVAEQIATRLAP